MYIYLNVHICTLNVHYVNEHIHKNIFKKENLGIYIILFLLNVYFALLEIFQRDNIRFSLFYINLHSILYIYIILFIFR